MSEANTTNWTNPSADWAGATELNATLKQFADSLSTRINEQDTLIKKWKDEVEKLTLDNHILREELARERAPKQDIR
jgi:hypothetical protein